jgi:hypothetical protein
VHFAFRKTVGAFVEHALQALCALLVVDFCAVFVLILEIIERKDLFEHFIELGNAFFGDFPGREQALHVGGDFGPSNKVGPSAIVEAP